MRLEDMREQFPKMPESMKQMIEQEVAVQIRPDRICLRSRTSRIKEITIQKL